MSKVINFVGAVCAIAGVAFLAGNVVPAEAHPTAKMKVSLVQGGLVIGGTSGEGYVRYHRRNYPITISGLRFGAIVGATRAEMTGRITNLSSLSDVEGTYSSIGASASLGAGKNYQQFRNDRGVHLVLYGLQDGIELSLDVGGMTIRLSD